MIKNSKAGNHRDEEMLLKEVMKLSEEEYKKEKDRKKEIERMEKTLALSSREESERLKTICLVRLKSILIQYVHAISTFISLLPIKFLPSHI